MSADCANWLMADDHVGEPPQDPNLERRLMMCGTSRSRSQSCFSSVPLMLPVFLNKGSFPSNRRSLRLNAEEQSMVFLRSWSCNQKDIPFDGGATEENITCKSKLSSLARLHY
jgi:hypothetical protein